VEVLRGSNFWVKFKYKWGMDEGLRVSSLWDRF
jgi:hypothetical protein